MVQDEIEEIFEEKDIEFVVSPNKNEIEIHLEPDVYILKLRIEEGIILPAIDFINPSIEDQFLSYILERNYKGTTILWGFLSYALCGKGILVHYDVITDIFYIQNSGSCYSIKADMDKFVFNKENIS